MDDWKTKALARKSDGLTWKEIYLELLPEYLDLTLAKVRHLGDRKNKKLNKTNKKKEVFSQNYIPSITNADWKGSTKIRFAVVSDTHIGSKYTQITHLHKFYDLCKSEGITDIYHAGDITDGENMRPGHSVDLYTHGADEHVSEVCRVYPNVEGITTHFITGNHDYSTMKHCGYDMGNSIAYKRPDMDYLGRDCAIVKLTPNCSMELRHPYDGGAYALSYKGQKMIESFEGGNKPNLLIVGNYHKNIFFTYRNVHCFYAACFQSQTPFMRSKGIASSMGGWIIDLIVSDDGSIDSITPRFIPYYDVIEEDWKNWR